jgi:hypothetical protein
MTVETGRMNLLVSVLLLCCLAAPGFAEEAPEPQGGGYLFAHMTKQDYGRLYYSVSRDGLHWTLLNNGKRVNDEYRGHPDILQGLDRRYYLIGNWAERPEITIWVSDDLIAWARFSEFRPDVWKTPDFKPAVSYKGAPKMFCDTAANRYVITWHTPSAKPDPDDSEKFWAGMRTLYVTSPDLKTFSDPKRLFSFEMATIDVIIRREGDKYYAIIKDEKYPDYAWPTGKTLRISSAPASLGPYTPPDPPITTNFREAPALIPKPDGRGWYLYYEQYPGIQYGCSTALTLEGPWHEIFVLDYSIPPGSRHGCMIPITKAQYDAIMAKYEKGK